MTAPPGFQSEHLGEQPGGFALRHVGEVGDKRMGSPPLSRVAKSARAPL